MFHKKTLGAAIAVALSFGVSAVQAGTFQAFAPLPAGVTATEAPSFALDEELPYAYEQFATTDSGVLDFPFRVRYTLGRSIPSAYDFYITYTLDNDATWRDALSSSNLKIQDVAGQAIATPPEIAIVNKGSSADNTVSFLVNTTKTGLAAGQVLDLQFRIQNAHKALKTIGGTIGIRVSLNIVESKNPDFVSSGPAEPGATPISIPLVKSVEGTTVDLINTEIDEGTAFISILKDGKFFEGTGIISDTSVSYGGVMVEDGTVDALARAADCIPGATYLSGDSAAAYSKLVPCGTSDRWESKFSTEGSLLIIENGNFDASGKASDGNVYIEAGTKKILATELTSTTAKWKLTDADLKLIRDELPGAGGTRRVVLVVNGTTSVNENRQVKPRGTFEVKYESTNSTTRGATLRHLKKNGTVCYLYNIPPSEGGLDTLNIRITNNSSNQDAFVKGTLRDMDGNNIFQAKTLVEQGNLKPNQTVRLQMSDLTADGTSWKSRAVLVLESNIPDPKMQVYSLLRANDGNDATFDETPLMNMSTGATGNSCD